MKACPQCESDQLKKASLVHEEGTGIAVGVGVSTHGSVGVGGGVTASSLALRCAPPKQTDITSSRTCYAILFGLIPVLVAGTAAGSWSNLGTFWVVWLIVGLGFVFQCSFKDFNSSKERHDAAMEEYQKTYVCGRCGTFSKPFD